MNIRIFNGTDGNCEIILLLYEKEEDIVKTLFSYSAITAGSLRLYTVLGPFTEYNLLWTSALEKPQTYIHSKYFSEEKEIKDKRLIEFVRILEGCGAGYYSNNHFSKENIKHNITEAIKVELFNFEE